MAGDNEPPRLPKGHVAPEHQDPYATAPDRDLSQYADEFPESFFADHDKEDLIVRGRELRAAVRERLKERSKTLDQEEVARRTATAVQNLSDNSRFLLVNHFYRGESIESIAERTGFSPEWTRGSLDAALEDAELTALLPELDG